MDNRKDLEEGEIEDDGEFLQELEEKLEKKNKQISKFEKFRLPWTDNKSVTKPSNEKIKQAKDPLKSRDENIYEMDEYELLLARHQLIQQQLEKFKAEAVDQKKVEANTKKKIKEKRKKIKSNLKSAEKKYLLTKESKEEVKIDDGDDEDLELLKMRKALLEQTSKKNQTPKPLLVGGSRQKQVVDLTKNSSSIIDLTVENDETNKNDKNLSIQKPTTKAPYNRVKGKTHLSKGTSAKNNPNAPVKEIKDVNCDLGKKTPKSGRKRRRGGRRAKLLAYRAQQKKELAILEQQQAIAFDDYNTVPMEIDDDEIVDGFAPLPLIETQAVPPPPPPSMPPFPSSDIFQPVEDQTRLSMTTNNVAWIPGYMETLEPYKNFMHTVQKETQPEKESSNKDTVDDNEIDEKEVWALRAQALKSLACKRASKVKSIKKVIQTSPQERKETTTSKKTVSKDAHIYDISPIPSTKSTFLLPNTSVPIKVKELVAKFKPPVHAPLVIKLGKEDFESSDEESQQTKRSAYSGSGKVVGKISRRRSSATDEELNTELRAHTVRAQMKVKSHSLLIQKDQLEYKKLNNELGEKKILFRKQTEEIKALQAKLQSALREKANTRKSYNKIHSSISSLKVDLKEKISLRKRVQECILKAKGLSTMQYIDDDSKLSIKSRDHIMTLSHTFRQMFNEMTRIENEHLLNESSQDEDTVLSGSSSEKDTRRSMLRRTAASVKNMSKEDLSRLELQLREQLRSFEKSKEQDSDDKTTDNPETKLTIECLPTVSTVGDLNKLKRSLLKKPSLVFQSTDQLDFMKELQTNHSESSIKEINVKFTNGFRQQENHKTVTKTKDKSFGESYENKEIPFKYNSPLLRFRSYRLNPYFRTQSKYAIKSSTFSNTIDASKTICKFDLHGTCNNEKCSFWHYDGVCDLTVEDLIQDLISYDPSLFEATNTMSSETKNKLLRSFTQQFIAQYSGKVSSEEQLLILWNKLKESRRSRKIPIYECVSFSTKEWLRPKPTEYKGSAAQAMPLIEPCYYLKNTKKKSVCDGSPNYESQEVRYFSDVYQKASIMEKALEENPNDVKLWISLARFHLKNEQTEASDNKEVVEKALGVLSRSLEVNRSSEDLWIEYLNLFAKHSSAEELRELSYQAVMYAATYEVWWTCLTLESAYLGKQEICTEMIKFIMEIDERGEFKSHCLVETLFYLCVLLTERGLTRLALNCLSAALGREKMENKEEKISIDDIRHCLTVEDLSFMWACYLSFMCFNCLPNHIFLPEVSGPGRLVNKRKFILDWKKELLVKQNDIRTILNVAFDNLPDMSISTIKSAIILYENRASFELEMKNVQSAVDIFRSLVMMESKYVEAWVMLLLLYTKHSPMDAVVKIAEEAIHSCDNDVVIVFYYSDWLFQKGMPRLALDKLTKCIHTYFQVEPDDPENIVDILHLYRAVLGLDVPYNIVLPVYLPKASQHVKFYYWLCYCLVLKIKKIPPSNSVFDCAVDEALESAVHQFMSRDNMCKLWKAYLDHRILQMKECTIDSRMCNRLIDLLLRCVVGVPAITSVRENKNVTWKDYSFQNQMVQNCIPYVPVNQRSKVYRKLIDLMPDNIVLATRICEHEIVIGNLQQVRVICGAFLCQYSNYIPLWLMAIQVECKSDSVREVRWLFEEAVKWNPFSSILWSEYASFEISNTPDATKLNAILRNIIERSSNFGVDIREFLQKLPPG